MLILAVRRGVETDHLEINYDHVLSLITLLPMPTFSIRSYLPRWISAGFTEHSWSIISIIKIGSMVFFSFGFKLRGRASFQAILIFAFVITLFLLLAHRIFPEKLLTRKRNMKTNVDLKKHHTPHGCTKDVVAASKLFLVLSTLLNLGKRIHFQFRNNNRRDILRSFFLTTDNIF